MKKSVTKPIIVGCSILWVLSVFFWWYQIVHCMNLPDQMSVKSAYNIFFAFIASIIINFILNPFLWIISVCFTRTAKRAETPYKSKWRFYQRAVEVIMVIAFFTAGYAHFVSHKGARDSLSAHKKYFYENKIGNLSQSVSSREGALVISGIMISSQPVAVVDGKIVKAGDRVGDYKVLAVEKDAVKFQSADGQIMLKKMP